MTRMTDEQRRIDGGCKCRECYGLAEVMVLTAGHDFGLPRAQGHAGTMSLRVVTPGPAPAGQTFAGPVALEQPCTGSMTCDCRDCLADLARRKRGYGGNTRQPWMPRPSRRAA